MKTKRQIADVRKVIKCQDNTIHTIQTNINFDKGTCVAIINGKRTFKSKDIVEIYRQLFDTHYIRSIDDFIKLYKGIETNKQEWINALVEQKEIMDTIKAQARS
jgi:hypothetical protein